jgi:hypothetical protein
MVAKPDQECDMHRQPEQPGDEAGEDTTADPGDGGITTNIN